MPLYPNYLMISIVIFFCILGQEFVGLSRGGQQIKECREQYMKALEAIVELASLQV